MIMKNAGEGAQANPGDKSWSYFFIFERIKAKMLPLFLT